MFTEKFAVIRSYTAGVFVGIVHRVESSGAGRQRVTLLRSRRLWKWVARDGKALSGVAQHGLKMNESTVDSEVSGLHQVDDVIEIIEASAAASEAIYGQ